MNFWISSAYKSDAYSKIIDSLNEQKSNYELKVEGKNYELKECNSLIDLKESLIGSQFELQKKTEKALKKETGKKNIWKISTGVLAGLIIYKEIKP